MKINNIEITGLTDKWQNVQHGWAFFAFKGATVDRTDFIPQALAQGASVIVTDKEYKGDSFKVDDVRKFMVEAAAKFFAPLPENFIAVTGTNGKTSTVHFCRYILEQLGKNVASVGSLGLIHHGVVSEIDQYGTTSPDPILLSHVLRNLKAQGCNYIAIEASSIGIEQYRLHAFPIKVAAFTNFSREHLDYHKTMEKYFEQKKRLFTEVLAFDGIAVLNADDPKSIELSDIKQKIIWYGKNGRDIKLINAEYSEKHQNIDVEIFGKQYRYQLNAPGEFQTYNSMCAIGMVIGLGFSVDEVTNAINGAPSPDGRMDFVGSPVKGGGVYVDYAHTPDGLRNVLESARKICKGRMLVAFGCGGDRDSGKRPMMGAIANELADVIYITDDNPRTENPSLIRKQIADACPKGIVINEGRREAIIRGIKDMRENDILLLVGKGHENYQIVGTVKYHFSDAEEARKIICELE